jgi:hypothetical protein
MGGEMLFSSRPSVHHKSLYTYATPPTLASVSKNFACLLNTKWSLTYLLSQQFDQTIFEGVFFPF